MDGPEKYPTTVTRIYIKEDGTVVVSDLWEDVFESLFEEKENGEIVFRDSSV